MKKLEMEKMKTIVGGKNASCAQALFWNMWVGGVIANGAGVIVGAIAGATGPNCAGWWG